VFPQRFGEKNNSGVQIHCFIMFSAQTYEDEKTQGQLEEEGLRNSDSFISVLHLMINSLFIVMLILFFIVRTMCSKN